MYRLFSFVRRVWTACGEPFPGLVRHVRYGWLGKKWPVQTEGRRLRTHDKKPKPPRSAADVAVIIPCHNYAQYLQRAIESVLAQTVEPVSILVVDDASDDDTAEIAKYFEKDGVDYLRVECHSLSLARNEGAKATKSRFLLFLDADDYLRSDYIEKCIIHMHDPAVGIVYADRQQFGDNAHYLRTPEYDYDALTTGNFISSHALIRRQAFDMAGGYRQIQYSLEDWDFYRRVLAMGYTAKRADTLVYYNVHGDSMLQTLLRSGHWSYANEAALPHHPLTIFTPFAGRIDVFDRYVAALLALDVDPAMIRLHWYNTSEDVAFEKRLKETLATLPFGRITYTHAPLPALWNHSPQSLIRQRIADELNADYYYQLAVARAYNDMLRSCDTEYVLTLEDDIAMPPQTVTLLQQTMDRDVAAVVAPYKSGFYPRYDVWLEQKNGTVSNFKDKGKGVEEVGGSGFGCTLFRTSALRKIAPIHTRVHWQPKQYFDQLSYLRLKRYGRILCNWDAEVDHMKTERYADNLHPHFT